jgi:hypothetical protein
MGMGKRFSEASMAKIASLENRLSGALKPVAPRKEFVHGLERQIQAGYRPTFVDRVANWHLYALLAAAVVSLAVFLGFIIRALVETVSKKPTT